MSKSRMGNQKREDVEIRIRKLKEEIQQLPGVQMSTEVPDACPPEVEEQFLEHVLAFEKADPVSIFDILEKSGVMLPPADELSDAQLAVKLREIFEAMALLGAYLESTDHLSDRELYEKLWNELLREDTVLFPENSDFACHLDVIGSGSEEDIHLYLKYYADEETRRHWAKDWPDYPMPEHELPPYDRDCHLPKRPL